jgi:hypothetical protein
LCWARPPAHFPWLLRPQVSLRKTNAACGLPFPLPCPSAGPKVLGCQLGGWVSSCGCAWASRDLTRRARPVSEQPSATKISGYSEVSPDTCHWAQTGQQVYFQVTPTWCHALHSCSHIPIHTFRGLPHGGLGHTTSGPQSTHQKVDSLAVKAGVGVRVEVWGNGKAQDQSRLPGL